jgi:hypothetical protein
LARTAADGAQLRSSHNQLRIADFILIAALVRKVLLEAFAYRLSRTAAILQHFCAVVLIDALGEAARSVAAILATPLFPLAALLLFLFRAGIGHGKGREGKRDESRDERAARRCGASN